MLVRVRQHQAIVRYFHVIEGHGVVREEKKEAFAEGLVLMDDGGRNPNNRKEDLRQTCLCGKSQTRSPGIEIKEERIKVSKRQLHLFNDISRAQKLVLRQREVEAEI